MTTVTFPVENLLDFLAVHAPEIPFDEVTIEVVLTIHDRYRLPKVKFTTYNGRPTPEQFEMTKALMRYEWAARMLEARKIFFNNRDQ